MEISPNILMVHWKRHSLKDDEETYILLSKGIREHVCEILGGGKEAFIKREQKYGFRDK